MNLLLRTKLLTLTGALALGGLIGIAPAAHASVLGPIPPIGVTHPALSTGRSSTSGQGATEPRTTAIPSDLPRPTLLVSIDAAAADSPLVCPRTPGSLRDGFYHAR
jgi:hypothetical protein